MKSQSLIVLFLLTFVSAIFSQGMTDKGSISISGTAALSFNSYDKYEASSFDLDLRPGCSFFAADNFELGVMMLFTYSEYEEKYLGQHIQAFQEYSE